MEAQERVSGSLKATLLELQLDPRSPLAPRLTLLSHSEISKEEAEVDSLPLLGPHSWALGKNGSREAEISRRAREVP